MGQNTDRVCVQCGRSFRGQTRKCAPCQGVERQCSTCAETFTGRYRQCDDCRQPRKPCLVPDCPNPKLPGQGSKVCQQHRDDAYQRQLVRMSERNYRLYGVCQMPECTEPKLRGRGQKYCAPHSAEGPERERAQMLRRARERQYGLTHGEYMALLEAQGGACAICGDNGQQRALAVDHDHVTSAIRGLLCDRCNPMLGYARDSIAILEAAIEYLKRTQVLIPPHCV
jgi:hypothetical protein